MLTACSQDESESAFNGSPVEQVTITFSPYDVSPITRTATSIADVVNHLDVWIYESGTEVEDIHQTSADAAFGSISVTLDKTKTYTIYSVAHKCTTDATLADGVIAFPDDKVTHSMFYTTTFTPATTTSLSCLMNRIVADFRMEITDDIPAECESLLVAISGVYDRWSVTTGGTHSLDRVSTIAYNGTSSVFNVYAITTDAQTLHTVTVDALDENDDVLQSRTFSAVPLRNGYRTNYRGTFFIDTPMTMTFTVDDWNEYDVVNF